MGYANFLGEFRAVVVGVPDLPSGTIGGVYPSTPPETGRDPWPDGGRSGQVGPQRGSVPREPLAAPGRRAPGGSTYGGTAPIGPGAGGYSPGPDRGRPDEPAYRADERRDRTAARRARRGGDRPAEPAQRTAGESDGDGPADEDVEIVPVRRLLSLAIAGFAGLLAIGLVFGAQTAGPGSARISYAVVIFGVQLLFILAWTMAMRPPALAVVAGVCVVVAAAADMAAVWTDMASLAPLGYVAAAGFVAGVLGQLIRRADRTRATESLGATLLIVVGVVSFATLIVLSRIPLGTQAIFVCLAATGVALVIARLTDAVLPKPRLAPQVPRGAAGVVVGAMCGTLTAAVIGSYVVGFTPKSGAVVGLIAAAAAVLADLAVGYAEAGRQMAGEPPTMWVARHMQGPLGGFALAAPAGYAMSVLFLG